MSDSRKADHPFEGLADCPYSGACHYILADGRPCWLTKAEHEAHPEPEPAPESEEPKCCCLEFWKSHPPDCPRVLAGLEKAGVEANEQSARVAAFNAHAAHPAEPITAAPEPLRKLARELSIKFHDHYCLPECRGHNAPGALIEYGEDELFAVLERVVRECADEACWCRLQPKSSKHATATFCYGIRVLRYFGLRSNACWCGEKPARPHYHTEAAAGLSPESAPEPKP